MSFLPRLHTALLAGFLALLLVVPWTYYAVPLLAAVLVPWALARPAVAPAPDREDALCLAALLVFGGLWCLDVWRTGTWPVGEGNQGLFLPLWPFLAAWVGLAWRRGPPSANGLWVGAALGAALAGGIAGYEFGWLGRHRADSGINAIPFGNLALLFGGLSLVAFLARGRRRGWFLLAGVLGVLASVFSGTRGGWVVFPLLLAVLAWAFGEGLPRRRLWPLAGVLAALLIGGALLPQSGVRERVDEAVDNLQDYARGDAASSLGARLDMWRAGLRLFVERPVLGWGEGRLEARRDQWVARGQYYAGISRYDQLHNDLIDTAARRGLVGLASLLALYGVPFALFARHLRRRQDRRGRALAAAGLMVITAFVGFGLSQSMLRDVRGLSCYLGLLVACWCLLKSTAPDRSPPIGG
ncbi:O-antigen ligase family protein [Alloalcanivorax sp. C16-2]|uniref:O-antigen ligase family protein n=1 Tax=Alloalcanivorax sp. C16-2 TaxID=3390052 RepID=UPI003970DD13